MSAQVRCQSSKPQILCKETTSGWQKDGFYEHDDCSNLTNGNDLSIIHYSSACFGGIIDRIKGIDK